MSGAVQTGKLTFVPVTEAIDLLGEAVWRYVEQHPDGPVWCWPLPAPTSTASFANN